jgi:hypothetical protein
MGLSGFKVESRREGVNDENGHRPYGLRTDVVCNR